MGQWLESATALYMEAIQDGNAAEAIGKYSGNRYTQHSTPVKDGQEGFIEFFADFEKRNPIRDIEIVRAFEDGRYVFLQHRREEANLPVSCVCVQFLPGMNC
jgi:predicted SnoaL-like aldol condensation-catalyzing enzyme